MKLAPGAIGQSGPPVRAALSQCSVWEAHGEKRFWKYCSHLPPSSCRQMVTISVRFLMCLLDQHHAREPSSGQRSRASDAPRGARSPGLGVDARAAVDDRVGGVGVALHVQQPDLGLQAAILPGRPKLLITPIFHDSFRFFPFSPGLLAVLPGFLASRR